MLNYAAFRGEITHSRIEGLLNHLRSANGPKGLYIDSPGGTFEFFSVLGPAIERQGIVTLSKTAQSSAVILALLGHRRQAFMDSTFFFHDVRVLVGQVGGITITDMDVVLEYEEQVLSGQRRESLVEWRRNMAAAQTWFVDFVSERTGLAPGVFRNLMTSEATLSAKEAQRYGIIHEIVHPAEALGRR